MPVILKDRRCPTSKIPSQNLAAVDSFAFIVRDCVAHACALATPSMKHVKRLEIHGLNSAGATYINSIAKDLPSATWLYLETNKKIELLAPMNQ